MHELGHAAGHAHPVFNQDNIIMECVTGKGQNEMVLSSDDVDGIRFAYSAHPYTYSPGSNQC